MYSTEELNKKYSYFYGKLKKLKRTRARAIKKGNKTKEEKCNSEIKKIFDLMTINNEMFSELPDTKIACITSNEKEYNRLMDEKEKYEEMSKTIENISQKDIISDSDIKDLNPKKKTPLRRKIAIGMVSVSIVAALAGGFSIFHSRKNKNNEPKEPATTTEEQKQEELEETQADDMNIEYTEKDGAVVTFDDSKENQEKQDEYTSSNSNSNTTNTNTNSTSGDNNSDTNDNNKKDSEDNSTKDKKTDKDDKTEDKKTEDKKTEDKKTDKDNKEDNNKLPGDTEPVITDNTPPIPDKEIDTETITETEPPAVPDDMEIEETPGDPANDEIYYDEDGNEKKNDNVSSDTNKETDNSTTITDPDKTLPEDILIEDDEADVTYYDDNGNEISKEEWEKLKNDLINNSAQTTNEALIQKYSDIKEELEQIQVIIEEQNQEVQEVESIGQDIEIQEEAITQVLQMK